MFNFVCAGGWKWEKVWRWFWLMKETQPLNHQTVYSLGAALLVAG